MTAFVGTLADREFSLQGTVQQTNFIVSAGDLSQTAVFGGSVSHVIYAVQGNLSQQACALTGTMTVGRVIRASGAFLPPHSLSGVVEVRKVVASGLQYTSHLLSGVARFVPNTTVAGALASDSQVVGVADVQMMPVLVQGGFITTPAVSGASGVGASVSGAIVLDYGVSGGFGFPFIPIDGQLTSYPFMNGVAQHGVGVVGDLLPDHVLLGYSTTKRYWEMSPIIPSPVLAGVFSVGASSGKTKCSGALGAVALSGTGIF
jgi:hypothetical protein